MSFYDGLALTATRLLTDYGTAINVTRSSYNFDNATNRPTSGGTVTRACIGAFVSIKRGLVAGTRSQDGQRVILFAPASDIRMGDRVDVSSVGDTAATTVGAVPGIIVGASVSGTWTIMAVEEIRPAGTIVAFKALVQR